MTTRLRLAGVFACLVWALVGLSPADAGGEDTPRGVPVLMYHRVDAELSAFDPITVSLTVMVPAFESQLRVLQAAGYRSTTLAALREAIDRHTPLPPRRVVLTFDDAYQDHYTVVFPLLRRFGFAATFFVVTSSVGKRDHLTVSEVREMAGAGMDIQSHGVHHIDFSQLSTVDARWELLESRKTIEGWTGRPVIFFAYPAGRYNAGLERLLAELGYRGALTERPGFVMPDSSPFALERVRVSHDDTSASFARKLGLPAR